MTFNIYELEYTEVDTTTKSAEFFVSREAAERRIVEDALEGILVGRAHITPYALEGSLFTIEQIIGVIGEMKATIPATADTKGVRDYNAGAADILAKLVKKLQELS